MKNKYLYKKGFKFLPITIISIVIAISIIVSLYVYWSNKEYSKNLYKGQSSRIEKFLTEEFDYVFHYVVFLGDKITREGQNNLKFIADLFSTRAKVDINMNNTYSWSLFDWITPDKKMVVSTKYGILGKPIDMSSRSYLKYTALHPWQLIFSDPAQGKPSRQEIIPSGVGITDDKGTFYGTIGVGFSIDRLRERIEEQIEQDDIDFIILDLNYKPVITPKNFTEAKIFDNMNESKLSNLDITINNSRFSYIVKMEHYPFYIIIGEHQNAINKRMFYKAIPLIVELLFMGFIAILFIYYTKQFFITPIREFSLFVAKITNNQYDSKLPLAPSKEMELLADKLHELQIVKKDLFQAREKAEEMNEQLEQLVQERTSELKIALKAKTEFLNNLSHEIRTPIQGFDGILDGLVQQWNHLNNEQKIAYVGQIKKNSARLLSLVGTLLDLSKFGEGKMVLEYRNINFNTIVNSVIEECKSLYIGNKKISIKYIKIEDKKISMDQERISQVLRNLITNAIKFSFNSNKIIIISKISDQKLYFSISDQGQGIPPNELDSIFSPFVQSSRTKTLAGGTGLGLSIAKEIIEAHGGKIWAKNNKRKGATFEFYIPIKNDSKKNKNFTDLSTKKILLVDDEEACLISAELLLYNENYELIKAHNAQEALDHLNSHKDIDLILLDLMMPYMDGITLFTELQKDPSLATIPVILQTGTSDDEKIKKALSLGIKAYLRKPYKKKDLLNAINKALN